MTILVVVALLAGVTAYWAFGTGAPSTGHHGATAQLIVGRVASASSLDLDNPETPIAWVASPLGHAVCTPYSGGSVCVVVTRYIQLPTPAPEDQPDNAPSPRASTLVELRFVNTGDRPVALPDLGASTSLQLAAFEPDLGALDQYDAGANGSSSQLHVTPHAGCDAGRAGGLVVPSHGKADVCGAFDVYTSTPLQSSADPRRTAFPNKFSSLQVAGFALFASRYFGGIDAGSGLNGAFAPPGWHGGDYTQVLALSALSPRAAGTGIVTDWRGRDLGYQGRSGPRVAGTPARSWLCGDQADDADAGSFQCQIGPRDTWAFRNPFPADDGFLVLHVWIGDLASDGLNVTAARSWIDVQYDCTRTGCSSERLAPIPLPGGRLPRGCGSTSVLAIRPGTAEQAFPRSLTALPRDLATFDQRAICEVYRVPNGSTMYEGGISLAFQGIGASNAAHAPRATTFYDLPNGSY